MPSLRRCEQEINRYGIRHVTHCTSLQSSHAGVNSYTMVLFRTTELGTSRRMGFMEKCQPFILWSLEAPFWLQFADNGLGSVSTNNRNISMITTTNNPCMDVILETPFASRLCVCLNRISYYSSCAQPPQNLRTLPLHHSPTITCSTLDLPFNHLPNSSIPWTLRAPLWQPLVRRAQGG